MTFRRCFTPLLLGLFILYFSGTGAQPWLKSSILSDPKSSLVKPNLKLVQERFDEYWKSRTPELEEEGNVEEGGYQQFRRWEWFAKQRLFGLRAFVSVFDRDR